MVSPLLCALSFLSSKAAVVGAGQWARTAGRARRGGGRLLQPKAAAPSSPARMCPATHAARWERMIDRPARPAAVPGAEASSNGQPAEGTVAPGRGRVGWFRFPAVSVGGRCLSPRDHCEFRLAYVLPARGVAAVGGGLRMDGPG